MSKIIQTATESVVVSEESKVVSLHDTMKNMNKSQKIRYLDGIGYSRSEISKILFLRYQFVRNVLITPIKNK